MPAGKYVIPVQDCHPAATLGIWADEPWPAPTVVARHPIKRDKGLNVAWLRFSRQLHLVIQRQIALMNIDGYSSRTDTPIIEIDMPGLVETAVPLKPTDIEFSEPINIILAHRLLSLCS